MPIFEFKGPIGYSYGLVCSAVSYTDTQSSFIGTISVSSSKEPASQLAIPSGTTGEQFFQKLWKVEAYLSTVRVNIDLFDEEGNPMEIAIREQQPPDGELPPIGVSSLVVSARTQSDNPNELVFTFFTRY